VRLYHVGGSTVSRSTLSDANTVRPNAVFSDLFAVMVARAQRGLRRAIGEATYLVDSTGIRLSGLGATWAHFSAKTCGAKVNDITAAQTMPIEAGATYVFDLGYYDYGWWAKMDAAGCRIVTRVKSNTPLTATADLAVPKGAVNSPTALVCCPNAKPRTVRTRSAILSARSASASKPARCCVSCATILTPPPRRLPISISGDGLSSYSSAESNKP